MTSLPDIDDPATILAWQIAMGADEAVALEPIDRFALTDVMLQPATSNTSPRATLPQPNTGPRPVVAKPVQSVAGLGAASAQAEASKANSLEDLKIIMEAFDGGLLKRSAKNLVFSDGIAGAPLMIVGEAPGAEEDRVGKPFVGEAGQLLDKMLDAIGYSRNENTYIANILPWRPLGNRTPDANVMAMCMPFIKRHIELANPKVVLMLGGVSAKALTEKDEGITRLRGKWRTLTFGEVTVPAVPAYHPAYLIRQPQLKGIAWRDFLSVKSKIMELSS
jgi:DNA polymerase